MKSLFNEDVRKLKGVGKVRAEQFARLGVHSIGDLLRYYPRAYESWAVTGTIAQAELGEVEVIYARVEEKAQEHVTKNGKLMYTAHVTDGEDRMEVSFFNNPYIVSMLKPDESYMFRGKIYGNFLQKQMFSPMFLKKEKALAIQPVYPLTQGLQSGQVASCVKNALAMLPDTLNDTLPGELREKYELCSLKFALKNIHFPDNEEKLEQAKRRLVFEEFLVLQLGLLQIKQSRSISNSHKVSKDFPQAFADRLGFELTKAQIRAINEALTDMAGDGPMNRLVQGDVGSGKTAVAGALCWKIIQAGYQAAYMAPTEILAAQHYNSLSALLEPMGINVALLTGSSTAKRKKEIYEGLERGEIQLAIGTHALISAAVKFKDMGLVITDEQHRFGVEQRAALAQKGSEPHLLVMSATPIPRTLALLVYGDLDVSVLDELPPGRQKIETYLIDSSKRRRAYGYIQKHLDMGFQGYVICPLVEEDGSGLAGAVEYAQMLKSHFPDSLIEVLHGRMKGADKEAVMERFASGSTKLLVSTTVVEVGVDVPNAVIMLIENAERFGLSQLHQLRGRIGRGSQLSTCILISDIKNEESIERLEVLKNTSDGFVIAEKDLELRGPGDFFGKRQHGLPPMKIADLSRDMELLMSARQCAGEVMEEGYHQPEYRYLRAEVSRLFSGNTEGAAN